jgi:hypothetical protein
MQRRSDDQDPLVPGETPRDTAEAAQEADSVQGWQEDTPTEPELESDDGYHPETGGPKYQEADPVEEELLAEQEGLDRDEAAQILTEDAEEESR